MSSHLSACAFLVFVAAVPPAAAQGYPNKPVRFLNGFLPGGATDVIGRIVAQKLANAWGQSVTVENRPGSGGNIAADTVVHAAPDGYTLLVAYTGLAINPSLYRRMTYDPQTDLAPVVLMATVPLLLAVHPSVPATSTGDLIALAKKRPGELTFPSSGNGSSSHLAVELFRTMTGINVIHVPYKGGAQGLIDLASGRMTFMINPIPEMLPYVRSGRVRALATTSAERVAAAADLPTIDEAGVSGYEMGSWSGLMAPAGTPKDIITRLQMETIRLLRNQDLREQLTGLGYVILARSPEGMAEFLKTETAKWARVIKQTSTRID